MKNDNRQYVSWTNDIGSNEEQWNDFVTDFYREEWEKLTKEEQGYMRSYRNHLYKNTKPIEMRELMFKVNEIHEKYQDFHIGCIP
jgi:hypothetical protein